MASRHEVRQSYLRLISLAIEEDIGSGDVTSLSVIPPTAKIKANIVFREKAVFCGRDAVKLTYQLLSPAVRMKFFAKDGDVIAENGVIASIAGPARAILAGERIVLNFIARLSGIATITRDIVSLVKGKVHILDTRKTIPAWRVLDKYAVSCGGGKNHRMGLYDAIMIKDNHIEILMEQMKISRKEAAIEATRRAREFLDRSGKKIPLIVEVEDMETLEAILPFQPDVILLDNMGPEKAKKAVRYIRSRKSRVKIEFSGGVTEKNVAKFARLGIDYISIGRLTHSARAIDVGLDISPLR